jgi:membrane protease YdiL (CAAX protease family)
MKTIWKTFPPLVRVLIYFILMQVATFVAGAIPKLNDFSFFLSVSLVLTWLFAKAEGLKLMSFHLLPVKKDHWVHLGIGTLLGIILLLVTTIVTIYLTGGTWKVNHDYRLVFFIFGFIACLLSAYIQEFVFRGYPYQTLLKSYNFWISQLVIAIPFGLMHVNASMSVESVLTVMLTTGLGSLLFGLAYAITRNLMFPVGIHFGWNFMQTLFPRISDNTSRGMILIDTNRVAHPFLQVVAPYLLIISITIISMYGMYRNTINRTFN